jgi:aspartate aminotransferase-like enzyme
MPPRAEPSAPLHDDPSAALASGAVAEKRYLFTPGPTPVPPEVLEALSRPILHHRSSDFRAIFGRCLARLGEVYRTEGDVLVYTASGTGGMESAVANLCRPGDRVVVVSAGHFGERWTAIARNFGCHVDELAYEWGAAPAAEDLTRRLDELGGAKVVFTTHSETSTGVVADVESLAAAAKEAGALVAVDAVSSLGAVPLETDAWGLDAVISGSQKALMSPPGLATVSVSRDAWAAVERGAASRFYFDWETTRSNQERFDPAFTPAVSIMVGLEVALGLLLADGLEQTFDRHARLGRACRAGVKAMGLELFSPDEDRSAVVTAIVSPEGIDSGELVQTLRDRHGIVLAPGQGPLKGKIFRIGHIGYYDVFDITTALAGVELVLAEMGADIERGAAVTAALEAFEHSRV